MRRASFLAALLLILPRQATAKDLRLFWIRNVHTGEVLRIQPFRENGVPKRVEWLRIQHLFRSWRTGAARPVSPRLLRLLSQVQRHFGGRRIELVSGYRQPRSGDWLNSYHQVGRSADLKMEGVSPRELFRYCRTLANVGCGAYPLGSHLHLDNRSRNTIWVDLSRYSEGAEYVREPLEWVRAHGW